MVRSTRRSNNAATSRVVANKAANKKSNAVKTLPSKSKTTTGSKSKTTTSKSPITTKRRIVNKKPKVSRVTKKVAVNIEKKSTRSTANKSNKPGKTPTKKSSGPTTGKTRASMKIKTEKIDDTDYNQLDELPEALKNVKTEVKVEEIEFSPNDEYDSLQNMSPLVHAADGRSRHNLVDGKRPFRIPPHLLGRNLSDPTSDVVAGSRRPLQKPRLGVKIPYRNLTSQIITHEELTRELLERSKRKTAALDNASGNASEGSKGYFFTMKLMARLAHRLPNPHFPELSGYRPVVHEPSTTDSLGFIRPGCSIDPDLEREIALKQLQELPTKRKTRDMVTEHIDYKRIAIKSEPLTPQQLALKQLEEIQIRKPRSEYVQKDIISRPLHNKLKSNLKFQVKLNSVNRKPKNTTMKLAPIKVSQLCKNIANNKKNATTAQVTSSTRASQKKKNIKEVTKTRFSSRLNR